MLVQAILIGLIVFIGKADYFIGTANVGRPLVLGALVGIVLGDIRTGVSLGFALELTFMGMYAIGASIPPDMVVGSVLGAAFAITNGGGTETALTIAFPAAVLSAFVVNLFYGILTPLMARYADKYAEDGNAKGITAIFLSNGFLFDFTFAVIAFAAFMFGGPVIQSLLSRIPAVVTNGLAIAAGILPALGFTQLIKMIANKKTIAFFILGFLLAAYLNISVIGVVAFAAVVVAVLFTIPEYLPKTIQTGGIENDDNEF